MLSTSLTLHRRHGLPENCNNEIPPVFQLNWRLLPFGTFASLSAIVNCQFIMVDVIQEFQRVRTILRKTFAVILETEHVKGRDYHSSYKEGASGWNATRATKSNGRSGKQRSQHKIAEKYFMHVDKKDIYRIFMACYIIFLFSTIFNGRCPAFSSFFFVCLLESLWSPNNFYCLPSKADIKNC